MKRVLLPLFALFVLLCGAPALATPTQFGETGLLSQPTADTLHGGNLCLGLWGNHSSAEGGDGTVVPVSITLGLGAFLEAYGSYPNILFNDNEFASGRGFANVGFKARVLGERSSAFKMAIDAGLRRSIADNQEDSRASAEGLDGLNDFVGRIIGSYKKERLGLHGNIGYSFNDSPEGLDYDDQIVVGGGAEYYLQPRLRLILEAEMLSRKIEGVDAPAEASLGLQFFASPYLTLNLGLGVGLSDGSPDWRALFGLSACQGLGAYIKPVPTFVEPPPEIVEEEEPKAVRVVKFKTLTPLSSRVAAGKVSPAAAFEIPVEAGAEKVLVALDERLVVAEAAKAEALPVDPMAPMVPAPAVVAVPAVVEAKAMETEVNRKFRLGEIHFEFGSWALSAEGEKAVSEIVEEFRDEEDWVYLRIEGHTDSNGSIAYNEKLSLRRAVSVATHMALRNGIDPDLISAKGYGESRPIADNESEEGMALNRRVEILLLVSQGGPGSKVEVGEGEKE